MSNLFVLLDIASKGFLVVFLDILPYLSVLLGISVINSKNPIVSVLFLIGLFLSISINLILLGYNFLGLSYLLVYVGAVSILFLFILMLINIRISELLHETNNSIPLAIFTCISFGFPVYKVLNHIDLIITKYINLDLNAWFIYDNSYGNILNYRGDKNIDSLADLNLENNDNLVIDNKDNLKIESPDGIDVINISESGTIEQGYIELSDMYFATSNSWDDNIIEFSDITGIGNILYTSYGIWLIICSVILLLAMIGAISITKKD